MRSWKATIKFRDLLTEKEDYESITKAMNAIADRLEHSKAFKADPDLFEEMRSIQKENALKTANALINEIYDICDDCRIWVE